MCVCVCVCVRSPGNVCNTDTTVGPWVDRCPIFHQSSLALFEDCRTTGIGATLSSDINNGGAFYGMSSRCAKNYRFSSFSLSLSLSLFLFLFIIFFLFIFGSSVDFL